MVEVMTDLSLIDELRPELVFPLKQPPVHLNVPSECVTGADNGRDDPKSKCNIVASGMVLKVGGWKIITDMQITKLGNKTLRGL